MNGDAGDPTLKAVMLDFLKSLLGDDGDLPTRDREALEAATAALLIEAAMMDGTIAATERRTIERLLARRFDLSRDEVRDLIAFAEAEHAKSVQLHRFIQAVNDRLAPEERVGIIEMLWEVVYADGALSDYEANLLRRIGGLLYVPDHDRGAARLRVLARLGLVDDQAP